MASLIYGHFQLFILLTGLQVVLLWQKSQEGYAYLKDNCKGNGLIFRPRYPSAYLPTDYDNAIRSIRIRGVWIVYEHVDFNEKAGKVEYYYASEDLQCKNLAALKEKVKSVRTAGDVDTFDKSRLDMFRNLYFQGLETTIADKDTSSITMWAVESLIMAGRDGWTFYNQKNYNGRRICLYPQITEKYEPTFVPDVGYIFPSGFNVRSVRMGCHSENVIYV